MVKTQCLSLLLGALLLLPMDGVAQVRSERHEAETASRSQRGIPALVFTQKTEESAEDASEVHPNAISTVRPAPGYDLEQGQGTMHPFANALGGRGSVLGHTVAYFEGGIGADTRYRRMSFLGSVTLLFPGSSYPYRYNTMSDVCESTETGERVAAKYCGSDPSEGDGGIYFTSVNFEVGYAIFGVYDGVYTGAGLRMGILGVTPYASVRWSLTDSIFFRPVVMVRGGADFIQVGLAIEPINFPVGIF